MVEIFTDSLVFVLLIVGLGGPWVTKASLPPDARLCLAAVIGCVSLYLFAWSVYLLKLPAVSFSFMVPIAILAMIWRRRPLIELLAHSENRQLLFSWGILAGWCLGLLALIRSYSGGEWTGDWVEHYRRTLFFLNRQPLDTRFLNMYLLPARPPLANVVLSSFLGLTSATFANYQVFIALLSSLAFFPAALLARRFRGNLAGDPVALFTVLLMLSPLFVQNVTFAWTKLPAAFFILSGLYLGLSAGHSKNSSAPWYVAVCFAAALLTHYSAAPILIPLGAIYAWRHRDDFGSVAKWRPIIPPAGIAAALLASWFVWSALHYGYATLSSNTVVGGESGLTVAQHVARRAVNFFNLIVPHPLRPAEYSYVAQDSTLGWWRDYFFNLYQTNLCFAFGSGGMVVLAVLLWHHRRRATSPWGCFVGMVLLVHAAVIPWTDRWGSVQIDLQPLVLIGLAWTAASMADLGTLLKWWLACGLIIDAVLGIGLHFFLQHADLALEFPDYRDENLIPLHGYPMWANYFTKSAQHLTFLSDRSIPTLPLCATLVLLLVLATYQAIKANQGPRLSVR